MGCSIPQDIEAVEARRPVNVVRGNFINSKRADIAALCSVAGRSRILVMHSQTGELLASLAEAADADFMQSWTDGQFVFSRRISRTPPKVLAAAAKGGKFPRPERWRFGIDDSFVGKASQIHYMSSEVWYAAAGAD